MYVPTWVHARNTLALLGRCSATPVNLPWRIRLLFRGTQSMCVVLECSVCLCGDLTCEGGAIAENGK